MLVLGGYALFLDIALVNAMTRQFVHATFQDMSFGLKPDEHGDAKDGHGHRNTLQYAKHI
jgi:hypothetical protein